MLDPPASEPTVTVSADAVVSLGTSAHVSSPTAMTMAAVAVTRSTIGARRSQSRKPKKGLIRTSFEGRLLCSATGWTLLLAIRASGRVSGDQLPTAAGAGNWG